MKVYLISDTHLNHANIATYCDRPTNFTDRIIRNWCNTVKSDDLIIHLGDVFIGPRQRGLGQLQALTGRKVLVRGNHDRHTSCTGWMEYGFEFACDGMKFRNMWLTHEPSTSLADGCQLNIHGHLHNIWHGFGHKEEHEKFTSSPLIQPKLRWEWQRLFAIEYTNYLPVEFDHFISHPDRYQARGPSKST